MQINQPAAPATQPANNLWLIIGAAWKKLDKKNREMLTIKIGNAKKGINSVTLNASDRIFLRANVKRTGINPATQKAYQDPDFQICVPA